MTECVLGFDFPCEECYYKPCKDLCKETGGDYDIEVCDFTGEHCFGDKNFCEDCSVFLEET